LGERLAVVHGEANLLGACPAVSAVADDEGLEGGVSGVVVEAACVLEQVFDADAVDVVVAVAK